jgi:hypothetical protein
MPLRVKEADRLAEGNGWVLENTSVGRIPRGKSYRAILLLHKHAF